MKTVLASAGLMAATASATLFAGDHVPIIYAATPYPGTTYNGTQYNATVINGVAYNASNEWPCLDAKQYESIVPACARYCIQTALPSDGCDVDDFVCHCEEDRSLLLDASIKPCLTEAPTATCTKEEIGQVINFVHGALCPFFEAVTNPNENCSSTTTSQPSATPSTFLGTGSGKPTTSIWTTVDETWTTACAGPTTFAVGGKTWTVDSATTLTVSDWPRTVTSTSTWLGAMATGAVYQNGSAAFTNTGKVTSTSSSGPVSSPVATGAASSVRAGAGVVAVAVGVIAMML